MSEDKPKSKLDEAFEIGKRLQAEGKLSKQALREAGIKRTYAFKVFNTLSKEGKPEEAVKPTVEVIKEPVKPSFPLSLKPEPPKTAEKEEKPEETKEEKKLEEEEVTELVELPSREEFYEFIEALAGKETWGEYGFGDKGCNSLTKLWYPVLRKNWERLQTEWALEFMALLGTGALIAPKVRKAFSDWREKAEKAEEERRQSEKVKKERGGEDLDVYK